MPRSSGSVGTEAGGEREDRSAPGGGVANFPPFGPRGCRHPVGIG